MNKPQSKGLTKIFERIDKLIKQPESVEGWVLTNKFYIQRNRIIKLFNKLKKELVKFGFKRITNQDYESDYFEDYMSPKTYIYQQRANPQIYVIMWAVDFVNLNRIYKLHTYKHNKGIKEYSPYIYVEIEKFNKPINNYEQK